MLANEIDNTRDKLSTETDESNNTVYHNAKLLLQIYSKTVWETGDKYSDIVYSCDCDFGVNDIRGIEIMASLSEESESKKISERLYSIGKNKLMIDAIHSALMKLKEYPYKGDLYYQIIYKNYFVKYKYTENEILENLCLSRTTYFRRRKEAIHLFGISLWKLTIPEVLKMF